MVDPRARPFDQDPEDATDARRLRDALDLLLIQQRSDGRFEGTRWGGGKPGEPPKPDHVNMEMAITALCAHAIAGHLDVRLGTAREALEKAEAWMLSRPVMKRGDGIVWVYADAFRLLHFAARLPSLKPGRRRTVEARMQQWVDHLVAHQKETGGSFKHYTYESTFVTASVLHGLHAARKAGRSVPDDVFTKAADAIGKAHDPVSGRFGYLLGHPTSTRTDVGASQRGPLCTHALYLAGRGSRPAIRQAVTRYLAHYRAVALKARHANFHIPALDNCAGYYFLHDFWYACIGARVASNRETRNRFLALWRALPEPDGSFVDAAFSYGKAYGTAMGLLAYTALQGDR